MFSFRSPRQAVTARVNAQAITVEPNETLLQAALRQGVEIPFSCRVGGCGTCRCTLVEGRVEELTETSYLLSEEFDRGVILACQSVPQTDVRVVVDLSRQPARRNVTGRVIGQHRLTHDITCLRVQLDQGLPYKAGQSARISVGALPGVARQYSFATPVRPDAQVEFFVRRVRGGLFSSLVNDQDLVGQSVQLEGPLGDFQLHLAEAPLLLVAGGSGLAPLLAMLREAAAAGVSRPTTLLFGARGRRDLYATEEIDALARNWRGAFRFVPVLSEADSDAGWQGERGLVAEKIPSLLAPGAHVYLCGPPAMIDSAAVLLQRQGVPHDRVHADRFTSSHEGGAIAPAPSPGVPPATGAQRADAGALHYLKFFLFHAVGLFAAAALLAGGPFVTGALLAVSAFYLIGDAVCGDDTSTPRYRHPGILTAQLWLALPLLALIVFAAVWGVSTGDPLGFGAFVTQWTGYDVLAARAATGFGHRVSAFILTGLTIGMIGTITAHELTHRTWDPVSMLIGRWLLAFSFDTSFAIEHVYGHHRYVSTVEDPATAPRGRNVYFHIVASTLRGNASAWKIEARRLRRSGHGRLSWHNAVIRGHLASALLVAIAWTMGGWQAALFFTLCALWGKALLEIVNYMEHYGMVRDPRTPVQPRHSWNTNRRISSWSMFNLTRHSHHHAQGEVPYQDLKPFSDAPTMIGGYLTTIVVAMIPPLWHRLMTPRVLQWDRDHASDEERGLAAQANARSGIPMLQAAGAAAGHGPGAPA